MAARRLLLVISSDPGGPVVRHRWCAYAPALGDAGIELAVAPWPKARRMRAQTLRRARTASAVVVSSRLLSLRHVRAVRDVARVLAFDFDDALPYRDTGRGASRSATRTRRFEAILAAADRVTAGNAYLAGLAEEAGRVATVLPTTVSVSDAVPPPQEDGGPVRLGFIGSRATLPYLESLGPALARLRQGMTPFQVRVIADASPALPAGVDWRFAPWTIESWRRDLEQTDVGLAPLPDDAWARGKCGLRLLQMMAAGRAVVAAPVGAQAEQVREGVTGLLARTTDEWVAALSQLLENRERRVAMGVAAHVDARSTWSVRAWQAAVVDEVEQLLAEVRT